MEIDDRFKQGLKSKEFNTVAKVDKYGNRVDKQDTMMSKFYNLEGSKAQDKGAKIAKKTKKTAFESESAESEGEGESQDGEKFYDEDGNFKWDAKSSSGEEDEEMASEGENGNGQNAHDSQDSSDEENVNELAQLSAEDDDSVWSAQDEAEEVQDEADVQVGKRLALTNMDWDALNAVDILALFTSFCKGDMFIKRVEIYPSLFGLE